MKLLVCINCGDIINLTRKEKSCGCRRTKGVYHKDGLHAVYSGPCLPIGFDNGSFCTAICNQPGSGPAKTFTAFVIANKCDTFKRVHEGDNLNNDDYETEDKGDQGYTP